MQAAQNMQVQHTRANTRSRTRQHHSSSEHAAGHAGLRLQHGGWGCLPLSTQDFGGNSPLGIPLPLSHYTTEQHNTVTNTKEKTIPSYAKHCRFPYNRRTRKAHGVSRIEGASTQVQ
jgi:hypothetical protein